ncbi:unnamed protein product [Paramecium pentaurelia]|uniref:Uncharacterized protein n=1 Tax=Paramecium pentaurelia TaxID=43138 RepID=A0A8S1XM95_9CILI|nr:unnamed protein product [Paramecium pentaurelia]
MNFQKKIVKLDLYFEKFCNPKQVEKEINNTNIQKYLNSTFDINDKDIQDECNNVKISDQQSMNKCYQKVIRPKIMEICMDVYNKLGEQCNIFIDCEFMEPIEIIFENQYNDHLNSHIKKFKSQTSEYQMQNASQYQIQQIQQQCEELQQITNFEPKLLVKNAIDYMKNQQMINNDGITVSNQFMNKFNNYLSQQNYPIMMIQIMEQVMNSSLQELENLKQNSQEKLFAKALIQAVEIEMIDEIEKQIFKSKIKKYDKMLSSQL